MTTSINGPKRPSKFKELSLSLLSLACSQKGPKDRSITTECPHEMAHLHRSAGGVPLYLQSWSSHLFWGRPRHCLILASGRWPTDRPMLQYFREGGSKTDRDPQQSNNAAAATTAKATTTTLLDCATMNVRSYLTHLITHHIKLLQNEWNSKWNLRSLMRDDHIQYHSAMPPLLLLLLTHVLNRLPTNSRD